MRFEQVTIAGIVAIIVSFVFVAARAQEARPCPSDKICPVCIEQDGQRSCKVEGPGQPELPQATAPASAAAPLPPEYRACITAAASKLPHIATQGIKGSRAPAYTASQWRSTSAWPDKVQLTSSIVSVMAWLQ
jgi:hypothetical protein